MMLMICNLYKYLEIQKLNKDKVWEEFYLKAKILL